MGFVAWEADASQDLSLVAGTFGAPAIVSDVVWDNHAKSLKIKDTASGDSVDWIGVGSTSFRFSFNIYFLAFPNVASPGNSTIFITDTLHDAGLDIIKWRIDNVGVLRMFPGGGGGQIGSDGSVALSTLRKTRISGAANITNTTTHDFRLWVDGVLCISTHNTGTLGTASGAQFLNIGTNGDTTVDMRISDVAVDASSALTDIGAGTSPDRVDVYGKRPVANGTTNNFSTQIGAGGSGYGTGHSPQVNEQPLSQTNGWSMIGAGSAITEEYTIEAANVGLVDISGRPIKGVVGWILAKALAGETASIVVDGVSTNAVLTTTASPFFGDSGKTTYPAGGADVGMITTTALTTVSLYEAGVFIIVGPPSAPADPGRAQRFFRAIVPSIFRPQPAGIREVIIPNWTPATEPPPRRAFAPQQLGPRGITPQATGVTALQYPPALPLPGAELKPSPAPQRLGVYAFRPQPQGTPEVLTPSWTPAAEPPPRRTFAPQQLGPRGITPQPTGILEVIYPTALPLPGAELKPSRAPQRTGVFAFRPQPAGVSTGGITYQISLSGVLTSAGSLTKQVNKSLAGTFSPTGSLAKAVAKAFGGTLTTSGSLSKADSKSLGGTLTSSGALSKTDSKALGGTLTTSGALSKSVSKSYSGTLNPTGALRKAVSKSFTGTLTTTGSIAKQIGKALAGALSFIGSLVLARPASPTLPVLITVYGTGSDILTARGSAATLTVLGTGTDVITARGSAAVLTAYGDGTDTLTVYGEGGLAA